MKTEKSLLKDMPKTVKSYDGETDVDIKAFQESLEMWPSRRMPYLDNDGRAGLMYATYRPLPCGCEVIGNGSLQFPMSVKQCKLHKRAPDILEALKRAIIWVEECTNYKAAQSTLEMCKRAIKAAELK